MKKLAARYAPHALLTLGLFAFLASLASSSALAAAISALCICATYVFWKYGDVLAPHLFGAIGLKQEFGQYEVVAARDAIVKKSGDGYVASMFLGVQMPQLEAEGDGKEGQDYSAALERVMCTSRIPLRFSIAAKALDLAQYVDSIKTRRAQAEVTKARLCAEGKARNGFQIAQLDRQLSYWNRLLARLGEGERPLQVICTLMTSAQGNSSSEAYARAKSNSREAASAIGSALNAQVRQLSGQQMLEAFELERFMAADAFEY
ncbi:hypothetical protein FJZ26_00225 [Candidatus Parvarchaeota archaeon]|nr:hypothetical protein [Candidatus Parvarchaeota archaeon]